MTKDARPVIEGWKEIARYFDRSVRSVQAWESQGLKIHRFQKRVLAYIDDLEEYKSSRLLTPQDPQTSSDIPPKFESVDYRASQPARKESTSEPISLGFQSRTRGLWPTRRIYAAIVLLTVASLGAILLVVRSHASGVPAECEFAVSTLIVKDVQGRELFRHQFPQPMAKLGPVWFPRVWAVGDIDGDGEAEVVFAYQAASRFETYNNFANAVFCFSPNGRIKWRFVPGRPTISDNSGKQYFPPYWIAGIKLFISPKPGEARIAVSSFHHNDQPDQLAVLNGQGKLVGEYWHPGWLQFLGSADLDHSGREKLLVAGVNNAQHSATLLVFEPERVHGTATRLEDVRLGFPGLPPGTEESVVFFPRSCVSRLGPHPLTYNLTNELRVTRDRLYVKVSDGVDINDPAVLTYELDYNLNVISVEPNAHYRWKHAEMEKQGILDHQLTPEDLRDIGARVIVRRTSNVMANIAH